MSLVLVRTDYPDMPLAWMDTGPYPLDELGHLFVPDPQLPGDWCMGCGYPATSPEASGECEDAEELAEESAALVQYAAAPRVDPQETLGGKGSGG